MPTTTAAFRQGRLSYSKVRELTRVVGLVEEAEVCELALTATASQLARMVAGYRRASGTRIAQQPFRALTWSERDDEMIDFRVRLPKEEAATVIAALNAAKDQFGQPPTEPSRPAENARPAEPVGDSTPVYGYAAAVLDVARVFLDTAPEDRSGEDRTLVVVHVAAEHLGDQQDVEAETARRLACDVRLLGAVDADGEVLSSGRTRRLVSRAQRRALMNPGRRRVPVRELPPDSTPQSPSSRVLGGGVDRQIWTT